MVKSVVLAIQRRWVRFPAVPIQYMQYNNMICIERSGRKQVANHGAHFHVTTTVVRTDVSLVFGSHWRWQC